MEKNMIVTFTKEHYRNICIDDGDVYEEFDVNIEEHWNNSISNRKPDVYKSFSELNTETKNRIITLLESQPNIEGETFNDIYDWENHFGDNYEIHQDYITSNEYLDEYIISDMLNEVISRMKSQKDFGVFKNPLLHMVQSEVHELKTRRELRKVKAERLIVSIRFNLDKSLKKIDSDIESKLINNLNN